MKKLRKSRARMLDEVMHDDFEGQSVKGVVKGNTGIVRVWEYIYFYYRDTNIYKWNTQTDKEAEMASPYDGTWSTNNQRRQIKAAIAEYKEAVRP